MGVEAAGRRSELWCHKGPVRAVFKPAVVNLSMAIQMYRRMPSRLFSTAGPGISRRVAEKPARVRTK